MTQIAVVGQPLLYPCISYDFAGAPAVFAPSTLDAVGEKQAFLGQVFIDGRATGKVLSTGSITFRTVAVTWATAGSTLRVGLQDLSATSTSTEPDGTFDVHKDLVQGTDAITASSFITATMNTGTKTLSHGDLIAVVFDMTARNGTDSLTIGGMSNAAVVWPTTKFFTTSWGADSATFPNCTIVFNDGTRGWIQGGFPASTGSLEAYSDASNPDERGLVFQVPWDCKAEGFWATIQCADVTSDFDFNLYSSPMTTPTVMQTVSVLAEHFPKFNSYRFFQVFFPQINLTRNTDYWLTVKATGAGLVTLRSITLNDANDRKLFSGGTTLRKGTRNDGTGAAAETTTVLYKMGLLISSFEDTAGAGGGGKSGGVLTPVQGSAFRY